MNCEWQVNMPNEKAIPPEETLDPEDWESMRALGHRMLDDMLNYAKTIRGRPVWSHAPERVKAHFRKPLPLDPQEPSRIYEEFKEYVLPYPIGCIHPRFWGWAFGTGTVMGAYAELLAAFMNTNSGDLAHHSAIHVEKQVIAWLKEMLGYPPSASGLLTTGTSAANLIGLAVARNAKAGFDVRREGMRNTRQKMVLYVSEETHSSIQKAVEILGLGSEAMHYVPVNDCFQIDTEKLRAAIALDREQGALPFCVVGTAGTVNTGAIDDFCKLADICEKEGLWLHIDGAFGAWAVLAPRVREKVRGIERADSIAFDLHKWMYMPYEIGCVLVRHEKEHRAAFSLIPAYLSRHDETRGLAGGDQPWFIDYGFELSRGFRALKAWMSLKEHGIRTYGRLIQQNIDQAHYLADLIDASPELELMAPVTLNIVCFRYIHPGLDGQSLDALNKEIIIELQEQGIAVLSGTTITGKYVLRVGHTNHRSRREDFDILVREVVRIGRELADSERIAVK
jgi:glutamate/tyrosine decarboxylase-like PLP-dependent enzyme